jgi:hypothetical protein
VRLGHAAAALLTSLCLSTLACGKSPEIPPFRLEGKRLTVNNLSKETWKDVRIQINRQYLVQAREILPGQRFDVSLDAFLDVYGNHFYYQRQQIKDVHLTAKVAGGPDVDTHMEFARSGLDGLSDAIKKKEKP